jgi:hypothetical protein
MGSFSLLRKTSRRRKKKTRMKMASVMRRMETPVFPRNQKRVIRRMLRSLT